MINPATPIVGAPQTGFTSPTYTVTADKAPDVSGNQWAVTAIGGTQAGVSSHSIAKPFTLTVSRPLTYQVLGKPHPTTGLISSFPRNKLKFLVRKGVLVLAGQPNQVAMIRIEVEIPAGSETASPAELRAMFSCGAGLLWNQAAAFGDACIDGLI